MTRYRLTRAERRLHKERRRNLTYRQMTYRQWRAVAALTGARFRSRQSIAGEQLFAGDVVTVDTDGKVWRWRASTDGIPRG